MTLRSIYRRGVRDLRRAINEPMQRWPINAIGGEPPVEDVITGPGAGTGEGQGLLLALTKN